MFRIVISVKYTNCDINILKIAAFFREEVKKLYCPYMGHSGSFVHHAIKRIKRIKSCFYTEATELQRSIVAAKISRKFVKI
jgi:hypothetical protein